MLRKKERYGIGETGCDAAHEFWRGEVMGGQRDLVCGAVRIPYGRCLSLHTGIPVALTLSRISLARAYPEGETERQK